MNNCKCFHHVFVKILGVLGVLAAIAFLYTAWSGKLLIGMSATGYFDHVVVFSLLMFCSGKMCRCCCGVGCGKNCNSGMCMPGHDHGSMDKSKMM